MKKIHTEVNYNEAERFVNEDFIIREDKRRFYYKRRYYNKRIF